MGSETDTLPQLDPADFVETIVLTDSHILEIRDMRLLRDSDTQDDDVEDGDS
ncbi:MAG TPA: hypothetical protein VHG33_05565 [Woeseiaceae bacterium]|nr:hypothetical protein [Woeseiaceae bacterium]